MEVFVGTSGWYYDWNEEKTLDWFIAHAGLDAVELNASFYRFPFPNQIKSWARKGSGLRWAVKVHRSITHSHTLNERAFAIWERFFAAFEPLDPLIDFYLFQMPPKFTNTERLAAFADATDLGERCAIELRHPGLVRDRGACRHLQKHGTLVSIDSPDIQACIYPGRLLYMRMHGREGWYHHDYSGEELGAIADAIRAANPQRAYIFFNNNQAMLANARLMKTVFSADSPGE